MKNSWYKKWWLYLIGIIILAILILIPFFINYACLEKIDNEDVVFTASDILSFYGSLLSFLGTVVLGVVALVQNEKIREFSVKTFEMEHRYEKRPLLILDHVKLEIDNCYDATYEKYKDVRFLNQNSMWKIELTTHNYSDPDAELYFVLTLRDIGEGPAQNINAEWLDDLGIENREMASTFIEVGDVCSFRFKVPTFVGNTIGQSEDQYRIWITYENIYGFKNLKMIDIVAKSICKEEYKAEFCIEMKNIGG
ncbi:hypothetical protein [Intestinimonas butyriciproducens]|uniref:hypothetical protein n=1 Tax=Intestinimonas butyriciproducens TaxID=1297617 RepID=UPI00195A0804|nr:hypothetical protein [Intestinimonas butyriciproducens]MBM6976826.1 hypothetical protein [Intestinimonas butyriciproducens]